MTAATEKERRTVRVDTATMTVYPLNGRGARTRIGTVLEYVENEANRTPTGGKFTSRRISVSLKGDSRKWVGQFRKDETNRVILRPL